MSGHPLIDEVEARLLAKTAMAFKMPIVLSTVGVGGGFNGPTRPSILADLPGVPVIDRSSMNAFEDRAFREAVKQTGRKRLIVGALHTGSPKRSHCMAPRTRSRAKKRK